MRNQKIKQDGSRKQKNGRRWKKGTKDWMSK